MKTEAEWEARARELFPVVEPDWCLVASADVWRERALQLGREMADSRAELERKRHAPLVSMLRALIDPHHDFYLFAADDKEPRMAIHRTLRAFDGT